MSLIDWSDPEEMFSLLLEYVEDERSNAHADIGRSRFLSRLVRALSDLEERFALLSHASQIESLQGIISMADSDFESDPVMEHLEACVIELERIYSHDSAQQVTPGDCPDEALGGP